MSAHLLLLLLLVESEALDHFRHAARGQEPPNLTPNQGGRVCLYRVENLREKRPTLAAQHLLYQQDSKKGSFVVISDIHKAHQHAVARILSSMTDAGRQQVRRGLHT